MSGIILQAKDNVSKTKETANETAGEINNKTTTTIETTTTTTTTIAKKTLTSTAALLLFDQLKNGVNTNTLSVGAAKDATSVATPTASAVAAPSAGVAVATLPNIDLKPPPKPPNRASATATRSFTTPLLGVVQGTKRARDAATAATKTTTAAATAIAVAAKLDINALRSQLYQGARKTSTTTTKTGAAAATAKGAAAAARGDRLRGNSTKKRCLDRYDSSESSDR